MAKHITVLAFALLCASHALANDSAGQTSTKKTLITNTEIVVDQGGQSIKRYLPNNHDTESRLKQNFDKRRSTRLTKSHFPVVSEMLSVGKIENDEAAQVKYQVAMRPIFIVGYDPVSIKWLEDNKDMLITKDAIGLVVNVGNQSEMNELHQVLEGKVLMQPIPGDNFAKELQIRHYPFYMDNQGVMRE